MVEITSTREWKGAAGSVVSWAPTPASRAALDSAPLSEVPASHQQEQHLRSFREHAYAGLEMERLLVLGWDVPGRCDVRAMTHVINGHLRRHDTYGSWFAFDDDDQVVRRAVADSADIVLAPEQLGLMEPERWREQVLHVAGPLQWDCFGFTVVQRPDHFSLYVSIDHLHLDAMFVVLLFVEIQHAYAALVDGRAPLRLPEAGSYLDYCVRQRAYSSRLTLDDPEVAGWLDFLRANGGTLPQFPLPLGDSATTCLGDLVTVTLMDAHETDRFESACMSVGSRFLGGVLACAAITEHELAGTESYNVITPTTTRTTPADFTTTGWFTGVVPISIPVAGRTFADIAVDAQYCFDRRLLLAHVPVELALALAGSVSGIRPPEPGVPMLSYLDTGLPPLTPATLAEWRAHQGRLYLNRGVAKQIGMWVTRTDTGTTLTVAFPDNAEAGASVAKYTRGMVEVCRRVVAATSGGRA